MKHTCEYCNNLLDDAQERCPTCGAPNSSYKRTSDGTPKTIVQLKQWYEEHHLPAPNVTRFFIGEDYKGPKAFGIYEKDGRFIVYKNKADGSRAIRYDGGDEAYAVNELYQKLKEIVRDQKSHQRGKPAARKKSAISAVEIVAILTVLSMAISGFFLNRASHRRGYYSYGNTQYYYQNSDWYYYDDASDDWYSTSVDDELSQNADSYFESADYLPQYNASDFSKTDYYSEWDSDSDWDSDDSWDSDWGDWDSDW